MMALSALRPPLRVLELINEVKEVLIHIVHRYQTMLNMANSVDPDETRRLIWLYTICKCPFLDFCACVY